MKGITRTGFRIFAVLLIFGLWKTVSPVECYAEIYQGTVVDEATGEPLSDAALVVIWWTRPYIRMNGPQYFHEAKETLTDSQGKFSMDVSPGIDWNPLTYIESPPTTIIYKPGYRPLIGATAFLMGYRSFSDLREDLRRGALIRLPKLESREEAKKYIALSSLNAGVPLENIPNLLRLVNTQRKMAGITSLYPVPSK
ncbi:MAG: hypothetical protein ACREQ7_07655 [Candidatus Binatia bacterium]